MGTATRSSLVVKQNEGEEAEKAGEGKEMARLPSRRENQVCVGVRSSRSGRKRAERAGVTKREKETVPTLMITLCPVSYKCSQEESDGGGPTTLFKDVTFQSRFLNSQGRN